MKVFYFTFLVLLFCVSSSFADCWSSCGCVNASCPTDSAFMCWRSCEKASKQNSIPKQSVPSPSTSAKKSISTTSKSPPSSAPSSTPSPSSSQSYAACPSGTYPGTDLLTKKPICEPCPEGQTIAGYCGLNESPSQTSANAQCLESGGVWLDNQSRCLTKESCESSGGVWNNEYKDCDPSSTASTTDSQACEAKFGEMWAKCTSEADSAAIKCADDSEEIKSAENAAKLIGAGSVASMQVACSKIADLSRLANGAFGSYQTVCSLSQTGCTDTCTEAKRLIEECIAEPNKSGYVSGYLPKIKENIKQCEAYKEKLGQAAQHAAAAVAQLKASEQCKDDTSANLVKNAVDQCKANPNSPLCKDLQKCSDANFAAQNPVCACATNPTGASCLQASANYGSGTNAVGATLPGVKGGKDITGVPGIDGAGPENGQAALGTNSAPGMDGQSVGGRQGDASSAGSVRSGGSGGVGGSGYYAGGGNEKDPLKVNSGTLGGAPGMGPGFFGRNTASAGGGNPNALNGNRGDIAKFDPRKYITGLSGKGEYINGANQNIFAIVKMRYEDKKPSMLPENFNLKK